MKSSNQAFTKRKKGTPVTDSVKVAQVFGKMHKNIMKSIRNIMGSAQNLANEHWFAETTYTDAQGKRQPMFLMNRDGFSLLTMSLTGEKAMAFKVAFINAFNKMEETIKELAPAAPAIPQSFAQALRLAAEQAETIESQQKQIEAQAPKVAFATAIINSPSSCGIDELAKILKQNGVDFGEIRLFQWLRDNEYLCSVGTARNQPTQKALDLGLFELKPQTWTNPRTDEVMTTTRTMVTGKGKEYFINKFIYNAEEKPMKIYVSGKISGLPIEEAKQRFANSQALLESIGFEVVNPLEFGLCDEKASWESHMVKDIELLFGCDAIYMMDNWTGSTGAGIEYDIAFRLGKDIWFESSFARDNRNVMRIQNAIHEVMGLKFSDYITKSRKRDGFYARMIFVHHCRAMKMKLTKIAQYVHRDHSSMLHLLKKYNDDMRFNPPFRDLATKVNDILNR